MGGQCLRIWGKERTFPKGNALSLSSPASVKGRKTPTTNPKHLPCCIHLLGIVVIKKKNKKKIKKKKPCLSDPLPSVENPFLSSKTSEIIHLCHFFQTSPHPHLAVTSHGPYTYRASCQSS